MPRAIVSTIFLAAFALASFSCVNGQTTPERTASMAAGDAAPTPLSTPIKTPTSTSTPILTLPPTTATVQTPTPTSVPVQLPTLASVPTLVPTAVSGATATPGPISAPVPVSTQTAALDPVQTHLTEEIPPCTPVSGSSVDPCEPRARGSEITGTLGLSLSDPPVLVSDLFRLPQTPFYTTHIVLRGTYVPGTVRCTSGHRYRFPSYSSPVPRWDPLLIHCFADVRVNAYLLGTGPSALTVIVEHSLYVRRASDNDETYGLEQLESRKLAYGRALSEGGRFQYDKPLRGVLPPDGGVNPLRRGPTPAGPAVVGPPGGIGGTEVVLFIRPLTNISVEGWQVSYAWDVERREDGTVVAIHPYRDWFHVETYRSYLEMELPALTREVTEAHQAHVALTGGRIGEGAHLPMLVTDANRLREYYTAVGAYNDSDLPPAQPPPPCGLAVSDQANDPGLMRDCITLLAARDTLRGSAALNWSVNTAITGWDGVTTGGTPSRVTKLLLASKSLSGSIPGELGDLSGMTHLNLSSNSLMGDIPWELGKFSNLTEIRLSGNSLTGCIPPALKDVTTNDLSTLNLLYCLPAPAGLTAGTAGETSLPLTWTAVANAVKYRVEYRDTYYRRWIVDDETITGTTHAVDGLSCESKYQFRVLAYGDGTTSAAEWSAPSAVLTAASGECITPVFEEDAFAFSIKETASVGAAVGVASATDPNGDTLTYTIASGNEDGNFAIDTATGAITVAGALDFETAASYTLTVQASDGTNTVTVTVEIDVTEVNLPPVFPTEGFSFDVNESVGSFGRVGYAVAMDPDGDAVTYAITGGNLSGQFNVDYHRGLILVQGSLNFNATSSYTLTVKATDAVGNSNSTTVTISVVQTAENPPPAPTGLTTSLEDAGDLIVTWNEVANASMYRLHYRTDSNAEWATTVASAGTSQTLSSVTCGATYETQVQAQGDGVSYTAEWGDPSESVSTAVPLCPTPEFEETSYDLTVTEDASVGAVVGTVAATYPDQTRLTYTITAGNDEGKFAIGAGGVITVAGGLDYETTAPHTLTVQASDGTNTATATAGVVVTNVNEPPVFDSETYSFSVSEDTAVWGTVGRMTAPDPDAGDTSAGTVFFHITAGNEAGKFGISTGRAGATILVQAALDYETKSSYTLTIEARDGKDGGTSSVTVEISVTNVPEGTPSAPENLGVSLTDGALSIGWDSAEGAGDYRVQYRTGGAAGTWTDLEPTTSTSMTFSPDGGPSCGTTYDFRVQARGDGVVHVVAWGAASESVSHTAAACNRAPAFGSATYSFSISEDASTGAAAGTVSATDPDEGDTPAFSITAGNDEGAFAIGSSTGSITVAGALDYETTVAYKLTVEASDGREGTATATVWISIGDVAEDGPPPPPSVTHAYNTVPGTFGFNWTAVTGADRYRVQYRVGGAEGTWTNLDSTTKTSYAFSPEGGVECGTTYEFRLQAHGDGETHPAVWGTRTGRVKYISPACNNAPAFGSESYEFTVAEDSSTGTAVGTVSATDADADDTVTYSITAGNDDGKFAIDGSGGGITVAAALDYETTASYTLTVQASDGKDDGASSVTVEISVGNVAETRPPAPQDLTATATHNSVTLTWTAPADSTVTGYRILRRRPDHGETQLLVHVSDTGSTATTYTDSALSPSTRYVYRVEAINAKGTGPYSNRVTVTTARQP